jgi:hypothetical protein
MRPLLFVTNYYVVADLQIQWIARMSIGPFLGCRSDGKHEENSTNARMASRFEVLCYLIRLLYLDICSLPHRSGERTFSPSSLKAVSPSSFS